MGHARGRLAAHGKGLGAVVAHHAAPQGVVQVCGNGLFVFAEQGLDDARHAVRQRGDIRHGARIFVSVPRRGLAPARKTLAGRKPAQIVHIKVCVLRGPIGHKGVHAAHKAHAPGRGHGVKVAQHAHIRQLEVVLHHGAAKARRRLPQPLPARGLGGKFLFRSRGAVGGNGQVLQIVHAGVNVNDVRRKGGKAAVVERDALIIQAVWPFPKGGADAAVQQKQLQHVFHFAHGGAAYNGHLFFYKAGLRGKLAAQRALFAQQGFAVERIFQCLQVHFLLYRSVLSLDCGSERK